LAKEKGGTVRRKGRTYGSDESCANLNTTITEQRPFPAQRILVIAENRALQRTLQRLFCSEGYQVEIVADDLDGLERLRNRPPSALILDLRYPASVGWELCREIVQSAPGIPFVVLSAKADVVDKIVLLEMGADDHMVVPFQPRELVARLRSLIRRATGAGRKQIYVFENVAVDFVRMNVTRGDEEVPLTTQEFKMLEFMTKHANQVVSRDELLNEVWGYQNYPCTRTVDNHILKLRKKLENNPAKPRHFLTIHGVGYKFAP
jgi:DNA-binding response OmpR family regulator